MMIGEIKNMAGFVLCHIKGEDNFVKKSLALKATRARAEGNIVTLKTIPSAHKTESNPVVDAEAERLRKDEMLTRWFYDWPTNRH